MLFKLQFDIQFDVFVINVSGTNYFLFHLLEEQHFSKNKSMRQRVLKVISLSLVFPYYDLVNVSLRKS